MTKYSFEFKKKAVIEYLLGVGVVVRSVFIS